MIKAVTRRGKVWRSEAGLGRALHGRHGRARHGTARRGSARHGRQKITRQDWGRFNPSHHNDEKGFCYEFYQFEADCTATDDVCDSRNFAADYASVEREGET